MRTAASLGRVPFTFNRNDLVGRRLLVIALDGATLDLIHPWIEDGSLPFLAKLRREVRPGSRLQYV